MTSEPLSPESAGQHGFHQPGGEDNLREDDLSKLPAHVEAVREGLLDFDRFLGLKAAMLVTEEADEEPIPLSAYKPDGVTESQRAREREFVESATNLVKGAQSAQNRQEWHVLIRKCVIERLDSGYQAGPNKDGSFVGAENEDWSNNLDRQNCQITTAKPSLHYGFRIQKTDQNPTRGFRTDSSFGNYTLPCLSQLRKHGLQCVPLVRHLGEETPLRYRFVCFPWAIVQVFGSFPWDEPNDASFEDIIAKASAAASIALSLFETLARFADEKHDSQHIPPVVVITSVGAETTVWLAYYEIVDDRLRDYKMISIWEGNLTKLWDAVQFCRIIDNLSFWVQHCLKPKVTQYLSQWKGRYCPNVRNLYSRLETDRETAEIVHRIQDRLSSLGTSPNEDLPALIRQAVVFQEVMRPSNKEVKENSALKDAKEHPVIATTSTTRSKDSNLEASSSSSAETRQEEREQSPSREEISIQQYDEISDYSSAFPLEGEVRVIQQLDRSHVENEDPFADDLEPPDSHTEKDERSTTEPSTAHQTSILQPKSSPEHGKTALVVLDKGKETGGQNSKVSENPKATPTNSTTEKSAALSKLPILSGYDEKNDKRSSSTIPPRVKLPNSKERKSSLLEPPQDSDDVNLNLIQRTLRDMASRVVGGRVISLKKQRSRKLDNVLEEKGRLNINSPSAHSDSVSRNGSQSASPKPFVSETFKLSFEVTPWLDLDLSQREGPTMALIHRHGPYPKLGIGILEFVTWPRRSVTPRGDFRNRKWIALDHEPTIMEPIPPPPSFMAKIPYRGRSIIVRLPPINPQSMQQDKDSIARKLE